MPVTDAELAGELARSLGATVLSIVRRPCAYETSYVLEDVDASTANGTLELVCKDVGPMGLRDVARAVKPTFLVDPRREVETYRHLRPQPDLGTPYCYAAVADDEAARYWLLLERVRGIPLWVCGEVERWRDAAGWLARLHALELGPAPQSALRYDRAFYRSWLERASEHVPAGALDSVTDRYEAVAGRLQSLPRALIHGEFYASNVLVRTDGAQQICAIDWEMTAVGPGVVDLAALTSGNWSEDDRRSVEEAYTDGLPERLRREPSEFAIDLACARLHLAVQWLGWAPGWSPPVEHAQDWLRIAQSAAAELAL